MRTNMKLYSIFDVVKKSFDAPFPADNDEVALRSFEMLMRRDPNLPRNDFKVFCLASINFDSGVITPIEPEEVLFPNA